MQHSKEILCYTLNVLHNFFNGKEGLRDPSSNGKI
jgi:hypothetical protein